MSAGPHTGTVPGTAPFATRPDFVPYVYGATAGVPSRGRPEKVLAARRDTQVLPAALATVLDGPPNPRGGKVLQACGTPAARRRHLRENQKRRGAGLAPLPDCKECAAADSDRGGEA